MRLLSLYNVHVTRKGYEVLHDTMNPLLIQMMKRLQPRSTSHSKGVQIALIDVTLDDKHHGELLDFLVRGSASERVTLSFPQP